MKFRFRVEFMQDASEFLDGLDEKARDKIIYNIWKARGLQDRELFKKITGEIWEFRTVYNRRYYRLFAFWDKTDTSDSLVISTHGIIKKTGRIPKLEIERAERLRHLYFMIK